MLDGGEGAERLKRSSDERDRYALTGFEGDFELPRLKGLMRGHSAPYEDAPVLSSPELGHFFRKEHGLKRVSSTLSAGDEDRRLLVLDDRDAISACGDEAVLSAPLKVVNNNWNEPRAYVAAGDADDGLEFNELKSEHSVRSIGDGRCEHDEYLGHRAHWTRAVDPSLGYAGLGEKLGRGIVTYADGCRFHKEDDQGLVINAFTPHSICTHICHHHSNAHAHVTPPTALGTLTLMMMLHTHLVLLFSNDGRCPRKLGDTPTCAHTCMYEYQCMYINTYVCTSTLPKLAPGGKSSKWKRFLLLPSLSSKV